VNRGNSIHPDKALGRAAFRTAHFNRFPMGKQGAGRSATVGKGYLECESKNTTLTLVITNQKLPAAQLRQLSRQIHTSMARAIYPFHTMADGDVLFMATTDEVENPELNPNTLGLIASEIAWDAVLNSVEK
jgi:L-aminopeptidase/D-esterase-like protein